jgi:ethanolamine ammonia-lyase large subunit
MLWGAISYGSRSLLFFVERSLNANRYIANNWQPMLVPHLNGLQNPTFQQDNARLIRYQLQDNFLIVSSVNDKCH